MACFIFVFQYWRTMQSFSERITLEVLFRVAGKVNYRIFSDAEMASE